ncbi:MAG TPA: hypothetical protein VL027_02650 [Spongiibacteraceae bacterium]|jgi:hypothetical protein|nr:hypothetical protein [Spongiibacteraceae bacterium]
MRGRAQAALVAILGIGSVWLAWLGIAAVALVTLRRGSGEGIYLLLWALLPAGVIAAVGNDIGPVGTLVTTVVMALVLRNTVSWPSTLLAGVVVAVLFGFALQVLGADYLAGLRALFDELFTQMRSQLDDGQGALLKSPEVLQIAGLLGLSNLASSVACLLLARWWQSLLYNPGGFRSEWLALRLSPVAVAALLGLAAVLIALGQPYRFWVLLPVVPLILAGFALAHAVAARRGWGGGALVLFYLVWLLVDWAKLALLVVAAADSWLDLRRRVKPRLNKANKD